MLTKVQIIRPYFSDRLYNSVWFIIFYVHSRKLHSLWYSYNNCFISSFFSDVIVI